jgi:asparagine synthase (glutamine-hydrolysing)
MSGPPKRDMQLYAVAHRAKPLMRMTLQDAVRSAAAAVPQLEDGEWCVARSRTGALELAAVSHGPAVRGSRRYTARSGDTLVLYDGLPVARDGSFPAHDANHLLDRWDRGPSSVSGVFSAVRADLGDDSIECLLDALGLAQVFIHRRGEAWVLSNSVEVIRLLFGLSEPDPLGVSSLLSIGWSMGGRTLLAGVEELAGGHVHSLNGRGARSSPYLSPASLVARRWHSPQPPSTRKLAETLRRQTAAVGAAAGHVRCGVTAGRDTRVLVAMLGAAGVDAEYYTVGSESAQDVRVGRQVADAVGAAHHRREPELPSNRNSWLADTSRYVVQTDGLAVLSSIGDWRSHESPPGRLPVRLWGMAGEIARGGVGLGTPLAATVAGIRSLHGIQRRLVLKRLSSHGGIVAPGAMETAERYLDGYLEERRAEGWPVGELAQAFYAFERIGQWAASGVRRTIATSDQYSPFLTRDFIEYAFSLPPGERYLEAAHYRLLSFYSATLRDMTFERPWRRQQPAAAARLALREAAGHAVTRGGRRLSRAGRRDRTRASTAPPSHFGHRWFEAGFAEHRDLLAAHPDSALWEFVDRGRVEELLAGPPRERWPHLEGLGRALTAFWFLHGPREHCARD